jgi:hypothetical protein
LKRDIHLASLHRRRPPVGHLGLAVDPQCLAGSRRGGGLALLRTGDRVRIDLKRTADILISDAELAERRAALQQAGGYSYPESQTPWQEIQRSMVDQLSDGMVLKPAVKYQRVAQKFPSRATITEPLPGRPAWCRRRQLLVAVHPLILRHAQANRYFLDPDHWRRTDRHRSGQ